MHQKKQSIDFIRYIAVVLILGCLVFAANVAQAKGTGSCGEKLTWNLSAGTLTIFGSGQMADFSEPEMAPWYAVRQEILRVELPDGLTSIGDLAFYDCKNLTTVVLPDSVRRVGNYAFANCTGLTMLDLGKGLKTIERSAFSDCSTLSTLRLPKALQSIGIQSFYRCESLTSVVVPESVTEMGASAFGYCKGLVRAEINARIKILPEWTFYGCERLITVILPEELSDISDYAFRNCESLYSVYYDGDIKSKEEIETLIAADNPSFEAGGHVSTDAPSNIATSGSFRENGDGTVTQENITVQEMGDSSVSTKMEHTTPEGTLIGGSYTADITVTVENKKGWDEAKDSLLESLKNINDLFAEKAEAEKIAVVVYVKDDQKIDRNFFDSLIGRNLQVTVVTPNGSSWKIDCSGIGEEESPKEYDFSYILSPAKEDIHSKMGAEDVFFLSFLESAQINARVKIRLPLDHINQTAVLFQREEEGEFTRLQAVVVDNDGYATFYLASVSNKTEYYIGINIADIPKENVIVPEEMFDEYGGLEQYQTIEYVVTGHKSSWGMTIGQVTWIMVGVLAGTVVIVGVIMGVLNKGKLKQMNYMKK